MDKLHTAYYYCRWNRPQLLPVSFTAATLWLDSLRFRLPLPTGFSSCKAKKVLRCWFITYDELNVEQNFIQLPFLTALTTSHLPDCLCWMRYLKKKKQQWDWGTTSGGRRQNQASKSVSAPVSFPWNWGHLLTINNPQEISTVINTLPLKTWLEQWCAYIWGKLHNFSLK